MTVLTPEPLTAAAFTPFGTVIQTENARSFSINQGTTMRFDQLAMAEVGEGQAAISIFRGAPRPHPIAIEMLERHPLGSQAFFPLTDHNWLVVVGSEPKGAALRCFHARGDQGVQYSTGIWHHPLLVLNGSQDFLVVDRSGPGENLEEVVLSPGARIRLRN
ncbi:MAG: ureidoglycolate lyase [Pseudomonadota bacterium]